MHYSLKCNLTFNPKKPVLGGNHKLLVIAQ